MRVVPDGFLLIQPRPESLRNGFFLLETQLFALFIIAGIFFVNGVLYGKQPVTVLNSLHRRLAVIILLPLWDGADKVTGGCVPSRNSV